MKKLITVLISLAMLFSFAGCANNQGQEPADTVNPDVPSQSENDGRTSEQGENVPATQIDGDISVAKGVKVGISYCEISVPFNVAQAEYLESAGADYGYEVTVINADNNVEKQVGDVEDLLGMGIDLLIVYPVNSQACDTIFELANKSKVDLVILNTEVPGYEPGEDYLFLATGDCYDQGYAAGEWAANNFAGDEPMKVLHLTGSMSQQWAIDRGDGFLKALEDNSDNYEIVSTQCPECSRVTAQQMTVNVLQSTNGGVNVIYTHNDEMAMGAIAGVKEFGLEPGKDVMIIGIDLSMEMCEAILDGELSACVVIDPYTIPDGIYREYTKYLRGEDYETVVGMELRVVDATNAQEEYDSGNILF